MPTQTLRSKQITQPRQEPSITDGFIDGLFQFIEEEEKDFKGRTIIGPSFMLQTDNIHKLRRVVVVSCNNCGDCDLVRLDQLQNGFLKRCSICEQTKIRKVKKQDICDDVITDFDNGFSIYKLGLKYKCRPKIIKDILRHSNRTWNEGKFKGDNSARWTGFGNISGKHWLQILNAHKKWECTITASLDRIDSTKGLVPGNVQWVHKDVNRMKNAYPQERFIEICRLTTENNKKSPILKHIRYQPS